MAAALLNLLIEPRDQHACGVTMSGDKLHRDGVDFAVSLVLTLARTLALTLAHIRATTHATTVAALITTRFSFRHNPHSPSGTFR
jgi:hypothetical protein